MTSKRYFVIANDTLVYYKDRQITKKARGTVNLKGCSYEIISHKPESAAQTAMVNSINHNNNCSICVRGISNSFTISILIPNDSHLRFYLFYLEAANQGRFDASTSLKFSDNDINGAPQPTPPPLRISSNNNNEIIDLNEEEDCRLLHSQRKPFPAMQHATSPNNTNRQSQSNSKSAQNYNTQYDLETENNIIVNTTYRHEQNHLDDPKYLQRNQVHVQSSNSSNLIVTSRSRIVKAANPLRADDCNVDTVDDVPHTNLMNQYAFSYSILDSKSAQIPVISSKSTATTALATTGGYITSNTVAATPPQNYGNNSLAQSSYSTSSLGQVGPQKRLNMTKKRMRSNSTNSDYSRRRAFQGNLSYTLPFGGDQNLFNGGGQHRGGDSVVGDSLWGSIINQPSDFDEEQLYPTRKSLLEFELEDICNDEIQRQMDVVGATSHVKKKVVVTGKGQTRFSNKENYSNILSFENYQDEEIDDDIPPCFHQQRVSPLNPGQFDFRKEFVRNSFSQFQNNLHCIDTYTRSKLQQQQQQQQRFQHSKQLKEQEEDQLLPSQPQHEQQHNATLETAISLVPESEALSTSKHLSQLKEMFKSHSIIKNLRGNKMFVRAMRSQTSRDINQQDQEQQVEDENDDGDDDGDNGAEDDENDNRSNSYYKNDNDDNNTAFSKQSKTLHSITSARLLKDDQLNNEIRLQASQLRMHTADQLSQSEAVVAASIKSIGFTDSEDCISLVSENNNLECQMNSYKSSGVFHNNLLLKTSFKNQPSQTQSQSQQQQLEIDVNQLTIKEVQSNRQFYLKVATNLVWNTQFNQARRIFELLSDPNGIYAVDITMISLLLSAEVQQFRYLFLESGLIEYSNIINKQEKGVALNDYNSKAILCESHMAIGLLKVLQDKKLSALSSIHSSHKYLMSIRNALEKQRKDSCTATTAANLNSSKENGRTVQLLSPENMSRYLLVEGLFQIGLSLMPGFFAKTFSLLGISVDLTNGLKCLMECIALQTVRSNYALIVVFLYQLESRQDILQAHTILKSALSLLPTAPIFNWIASVYYWKVAQSAIAVRYISSAAEMSRKYGGLTPHFMNFELGWYNLSEFQWDAAVSQFESILIGGFDFLQVDKNSFMKKVVKNPGIIARYGASMKKVPSHLEDFEKIFKEFEAKFKSCSFTGKVKILHLCCIAFIVGVCHVSRAEKAIDSSDSSDELLSQRMQQMLSPECHLDNPKPLMKQLFESDQSQQYFQLNAETTMKEEHGQHNKHTGQRNIPIGSTKPAKEESNSQQKASKKLEEKWKMCNNDISKKQFEFYCMLGLVIYDKLGDSRSKLDDEFKKLIKLYLVRQSSYLIKFELLYFVKELSKVSDENLDCSLKEITQYQRNQLVAFALPNQASENLLIEICSAYLLIVGINYIRNSFEPILSLTTTTSTQSAGNLNPGICSHLRLLPKSHHYLAHHTFYWLGMSFKKNGMNQLAIQYFELSRSFKSTLFNLSARIDANISTILTKRK